MERLLLSATFTAKFKLAFVLTQENALALRVFILNPTERAQVLLKSGTKYCQNSPPFERSAWSYVTITGNFERFPYFNFEKHFLKSENFFQKTGVSFLVKSTRIENATFPYKTPLSEASVKRKWNGEYKMDLSYQSFNQ